jgi:hypothetical protein
MPKIIILLICFLLFSCSFVEAEWLQNGKAVTDSPYAKTDGDFGAKLFFTDKAQELFETWNKEGSTVKVSEVDDFRVNQEITALIVFSNCAPDSRNKANVSVDFQVFSPKGSLVAKRRNLEVWINRPVLGYRDLGLSVDFLKITIGEKQPKGEYIVKAFVFDRNSGKKLSLERKFFVK